MGCSISWTEARRLLAQRRGLYCQLSGSFAKLAGDLLSPCELLPQPVLLPLSVPLALPELPKRLPELCHFSLKLFNLPLHLVTGRQLPEPLNLGLEARDLGLKIRNLGLEAGNLILEAVNLALKAVTLGLQVCADGRRGFGRTAGVRYLSLEAGDLVLQRVDLPLERGDLLLERGNLLLKRWNLQLNGIDLCLEIRRNRILRAIRGSSPCPKIRDPLRFLRNLRLGISNGRPEPI
jgi:hypothetical protein